MFNFLSMAGNYDQRKVENTKINGVEIDTCRVTDSRQPYETALHHPDYNDDGWIVVEMYYDKDAAIEGHKKWVNLFSDSEHFPESLTDTGTSDIGELANSFGAATKYRRKNEATN